MMLNESAESGNWATPHHQSPEIVLLFYVVTFLVGVPGNLLVLWVTGVKMKRTVNTIWFWNLALADITCCLCLPFSIAQSFYAEWLYGSALCRILPSVVILNMFASVFTLVAISIDRCVLVVFPVWAQNHRSLQMAWLACLAIWIMSFFMCLPAFLYRYIDSYDNVTLCSNHYGNYPSIDYYYDFDFYANDTDDLLVDFTDFTESEAAATEFIVTITRTIFGFLFPLIIISACYIRLTLKVQNSRFGKEGRKTTKVVASIIVVFFVTWAPYHIIGIILLYISTPAVHKWDEISQALAYFNSCINPILYVFMGKDFKSKLKQSLHRLMESAFSEELTRTTERSRSRGNNQDSVAL